MEEKCYKKYLDTDINIQTLNFNNNTPVPRQFKRLEGWLSA